MVQPVRTVVKDEDVPIRQWGWSVLAASGGAPNFIRFRRFAGES